MKLKEVRGVIRDVNFETGRGFYFNCELFPCGERNTVLIESQIPVASKDLESSDLQKDFYNRKIRLTIELLED